MCSALNRDSYRLSYSLGSCAVPDVLIRTAFPFSHRSGNGDRCLFSAGEGGVAFCYGEVIFTKDSQLPGK